MKLNQLILPSLVSLLLISYYDLSGLEAVIATFMSYMLAIGFVLTFKLHHILELLKAKK